MTRQSVSAPLYTGRREEFERDMSVHMPYMKVQTKEGSY